MCTVTFVPIPTGYILTSSRDEKNIRPTRIPDQYEFDGHTLFFPKDEVAGGTWIASDNKSKTACLLNGAFDDYSKQSSYRKSRGLILLDSFHYPTFIDFTHQIDLHNIEPFTLLLIDSSPVLTFLELRWDGAKKHIAPIDTQQPHIWSSATLYNKTIQKKREDWFKKLLTLNSLLSKEILQKFHLTKKDVDFENDMIMQRENGLQTLSVSQIVVENNRKEFTYFDFITNRNYILSIYE